MIAKIYNSTFINCTSAGIYGESRGLRAVEPVGNSYLKPFIKNCLFQDSRDGCVFLIWGQSQSIVSNYRSGFAHPVIAANVFSNLTGSALSLSVANFAGGGQPVFANNTLINCHTGVEGLDPWNAIIQNNIFVGCTNAVKKTGSLSLTTSYNAFHENAANFGGYPPNYGAPIIPNRNGTMADLFFNIFENPQFVGANDLRLATGSPCIDAGTSGWEFTDMCFPPGQGTAFPDLGAYGGPDACNWLEVVPLASTTPWMSVTNNTAYLNWDAIPRSSYRIEYLTNAMDTQWKNLVDLIPLEKRNSRNVTATNSERYFRIQSLGRTPGS